MILIPFINVMLMLLCKHLMDI